MDTLTRELVTLALEVSQKFITKVDTGRARSRETYADMLRLRALAHDVSRNNEPDEARS